MDKSKLRREILSRRENLTKEERERASLLLTERMAGHQWFYRAKYFLGFAGYGSEIDTYPLLEEALLRGKKVYVPKVEGDGMEFYPIASTDELRPGYRGIPEPEGCGAPFDYRECKKQGETDRVLMLMPGVAFDPCRNRLGYGKGFYDRYLAGKEELALRTVAVGFQCQMVERIPTEEYDIRPGQVICV